MTHPERGGARRMLDVCGAAESFKPVGAEVLMLDRAPERR
jgi:hypothetical protein